MKYKYLLSIVVLLYVVGLLKADKKLCNELKPCGQRGVCAITSHHVESTNVLAIKCHCRHNYTGQWCQFVDGKYQAGPTGKVPAKPVIITDTNIPNYHLKYQLKFKGARDPSKNRRVLYYLLRYTDRTISEGEWRSIPIKVHTKDREYKLVLDMLDWGHKYKLELYAGNRFGLSKPNKKKLIRPKVSEPRMVKISNDVTGSNSDLRIKLHCKAEGTPEPTYSWRFNDLPFLKSSNVVVKGGILTISQPSDMQHKGEYRCVASNSWGKVMSRPVKLNISEPVKGKDGFSHIIAPHIIVYQGTTLAMNCGNSKRLVKWFYNGVPINKQGMRKDGVGSVSIDGRLIDIRYKLHQGRLELDNTKPVATGIYQCDVRTKDSLITRTRYVHVRNFDHIEPLSLKHKTSDKVRLKDGTTATLTCLPTPTHTPIVWKNFPRKTDKRFRKLPNGFLEVRDIRKSDSNLQITCESLIDNSVSIRRLIRTSVLRSVDGGWSNWGSWQPCRKKECVRRTRYRQCNNPAPRYDGKYCPGPGSEKSGVWSSWTPWSCVPLQGKCGKHHKVRTRSCQGDYCLGEKIQSQSCKYYIPCPVDGFWTAWSSWSACTSKCYPGGTTTRSRKCKLPKHGGKMCKGRFSISKKCNSNERCAINGGWTTWSPWTECSASCKGGTKSRDRTCTNPVPQREGLDCDGVKSMTVSCNASPCKVDGGWSAWSDFSACSVSCGAGVKYSTRTCNNPRAKHGGKECEGNSQYRTQCDMPPCKVNGSWSTWSAWSECSTTCDVGIKSRVRNCTNPAPQHGGHDCIGKSNNETSCNRGPCEVHGRWSSWSEWSSCSVTCGSGVKSRVRSCTNPTPKYGGKQCPGKHEFEAECHNKLCEGEPSEENVLSDMKYIQNKSSSNNSLNAILYIAVGGCSTLLLIALLFCFFKFPYVRSLTKSYMPMIPLTRIKTEPVILKSILKSKKRRRKTPDDLDLPTKSTKRSSMTSEGSEVPSKSAKHGSFPPPPPPLSNNATSSRPRRKRRAPTRNRKRDETKKEANTSDDDMVELDKAAVKSGKAKDIPVHKMSKDSESPSVPYPPMSSTISRVPTAMSSDKNEKIILEPAGKVKDTTVSASGSNIVTAGSLTADHEIDVEKSEKTGKDSEGQKVPPLKKDSSSSSVIKEPSELPSVSSGPSAVVAAKSSNTRRSSSVCRSLIEFENAILETGDDQVNAGILRMKSKSRSKKSED